MKVVNALAAVLLLVGMGLAQNAAPASAPTPDTASIQQELQQLRDAVAAQQKQIQQQQKQIEQLRQERITEVSDAVAAVSPQLVNANLRTGNAAAGLAPTPIAQQKKTAPAPPPVISAVVPVRVLQLEPTKPGGLIPDIKLGSKASMKLYGFFKASVPYDSSSPYGNDFPLPGFIGADSGPNKSPEFHVKARAFRIGSAFEWPDKSKRIVLTGKIETDYEGDFTRVNNRNISSIRSSQLSLRLAYGRLDFRPSDQTSYFLLAGQDWSPFGSSLLSNMLESTIYAVGFGNLYEREPQLRVGMFHKFGGSRNFGIGPEFAIAMPAFGVTPTDLANQLGYGERLGADSSKPAVEGRVVLQFQADHAKAVPPAQIVFSGMHASRSALVTKTSLAGAAFAGVSAADKAAILAAFPEGATADADRWGAQAGFSIPTRFATITTSYYRGTDLRWYFEGGLYPVFNQSLGLQTGSSSGIASIDGASTVLFGCAIGTGGTTGVACVPSIGPQLPVRSQGGFVELGFPLSRIFNADPAGRNAGWSMNLHYGIDAPLARDVRAASNSGNQFGTVGGRGTSDLGLGNIQWKINPWLTFGIEESYYRTRAVAGFTGTLPKFNAGLPSHQWHDFRSEFFTIFSF